MKLLYLGTVSDGRLKLSHRKQFDEDLKQFEGKRVEVVISKANKRRSNDQNAYYWGAVIPCAVAAFRDAGYIGLTSNDVHKYFKDEYLQEGVEIVNPRTGEVKTINKTTTVISTTAMKDYIEQIAMFLAEWFNVVLPEPSPIWNEKV